MRNCSAPAVRSRLLLFALAGCLAAGSSSLARAQDLDELMQTDPEQEQDQAAPSGDADDEQPASNDEGGSSAGDDEMSAGADEERPPGDAVEQSGEEEEETGEESQPAAEEEPRNLSVGLLAGYGASLETGPNTWGGGFGLQGGYDLGAVTLGVRFVYYLGGTGQELIGSRFVGDSTTRDVTENIWELGVELGIDIDLAEQVVLRPGAGLGFASATRGSASNLYAALSPGAALLYGMGAFYIGLDGRFQVVFADPQAAKAVIFLATVGMRF